MVLVGLVFLLIYLFFNEKIILQFCNRATDPVAEAKLQR